MSTLAAVSVPSAQARDLPAARDCVQGGFSAVEKRFSVFLPTSDLSRINDAAGNGSFITISYDVGYVLHAALRLAADSDGVFDPTVGPLMAAWGFRGNQPPHPPTPEVLADVRRRVSWTNVIWQAAASNQVRLALPGMRLDLGGIAKGYAVDLAFAGLLQTGKTDFLVDLGGNLRAFGQAAPGRGGWLAGIRNPFTHNLLIGTILLTNGEAVATSGSYERFVELDGHRYAHIMDPRTGQPAEGVAGVTVLAPSGIQCDGLSATLFILGPAAGRDFLKQHRPDCDALWVPAAQPVRLIATPGFARRFKPLPVYRQMVTVLP